MKVFVKLLICLSFLSGCSQVVELIPQAQLKMEGVAVVSDENSDQIANPGETFYLRIKLKNTGMENASDVTGSLSSDNPSVKISYEKTDQGLFFGAINKSQSRCGFTSTSKGTCRSDKRNVKISIPSEMAEGNIPFTLELTDGGKSLPALQFDLEIRKVDFQFQVRNVAVVSDENDDKTANPGESFHLKIKLKNTGSGKALDTVGNLISLNPQVKVDYYAAEDKLFFGNFPIQAERCAFVSSSPGTCRSENRNPRVTLPADFQEAQIPLALKIQDRWGKEQILEIQVPVQKADFNFQISKNAVVSDENSDQVANPGEIFHLNLKLKNSGTGKALGVTAKLSSSHPDVKITYHGSDESLYLGNVPPTAQRCAYISNSKGTCRSDKRNPRIVIPTSMEEGKIPFSLLIQDQWGKSQTVNFEVLVKKPNFDFKVKEVAVVSDQNRDKVANPGETFHLRIKVKNEGTAKALAVVGTVTASNSNIKIKYNGGDQNLFFGNVSRNWERCAYISSSKGTCRSDKRNIEVRLPSQIGIGNVSFTLKLKDQWGNEQVLKFKLPVKLFAS